MNGRRLNLSGYLLGEFVQQSQLEHQMNHVEFLQTRQKYWKNMVATYEPNVELLQEGQTSLETTLVVFAKGPRATFAVFENDGESGYLYVYDSSQHTVKQHLHLYDRVPGLEPTEEDVKVLWTRDGNKCGVLIWGKMRGVMDLANQTEGRAWLERRDTPGISQRNWLEGFDLPQ